MNNLKELVVIGSLIATIVGVGVWIGRQSESTEATKEVLKETQMSVKENTMVNVRQTVVLDTVVDRLEKLK